MDTDAKNKLVPIPGDILDKNLGISESDTKLLQENVNIVIHSAANIRFDVPIR